MFLLSPSFVTLFPGRSSCASHLPHLDPVAFFHSSKLKAFYACTSSHTLHLLHLTSSAGVYHHPVFTPSWVSLSDSTRLKYVVCTPSSLLICIAHHPSLSPTAPSFSPCVLPHSILLLELETAAIPTSFSPLCSSPTSVSPLSPFFILLISVTSSTNASPSLCMLMPLLP